MSPMAEDLDTNHNDNNHSPAGSAGSVGSGGSTGAGIPMLVVHKREMVQIMEDHHHQQENHHNQHGHMEADDDQAIDDQDTDGDALSPQKRPLNNNNNDVATVFLIDTSEVGGGHEDADQAVEVDEVCRLFLFIYVCLTVYPSLDHGVIDVVLFSPCACRQSRVYCHKLF